MAYKRECFGGKGALARMLDRLFLSLLGALSLYGVLAGKPSRLLLAIISIPCTLTLLIAWDERRFRRFMRAKRKKTEERLRMVRFIQRGGEGPLPQGEEAFFSLEPVTVKEMQKRCLMSGCKAFRLYQKEDPSLILAAEELGCRVRFCPEALEKVEVEGEEIERRLWMQAPIKKSLSERWRRFRAVSGKRFLLAGGLLTLLSFFLPYGLFFRLLGTAAFAYGGVNMGMSLERKA